MEPGVDVLLAAGADIATIVTGFAVCLAVVPFFETRKQRARDADQWYVDRYWMIQDRKHIRRRGGRVIAHSPLDVLYAELKLCEDELDARANGWVTNSSWKIWADSIAALRTDHGARDLLAQMPSNEMVRLREFFIEPADPQQIGVVRQWWRGLR